MLPNFIRPSINLRTESRSKFEARDRRMHAEQSDGAVPPRKLLGYYDSSDPAGFALDPVRSEKVTLMPNDVMREDRGGLEGRKAEGGRNSGSVSGNHVEECMWRDACEASSPEPSNTEQGI